MVGTSTGYLSTRCGTGSSVAGEANSRNWIQSIGTSAAAGRTATARSSPKLLKVDREAAVEYLKNDLQMTARVAARMGVI